MTSRPADAVTTRECPACHTTAPVAAFCANCGIAATSRVPRHLLVRPRTFAVAPGEPIFLPAITSTLFPRLSEDVRTTFRHCVFLLLAALVGFSLLRLPGPLVVFATLGLQLLFVLYLWRSDVFRDMPRRSMVLSGAIGAGIGVAWWLLTGVVIAGEYDVPLAVGSQLEHVLVASLVMDLLGIVAMMVPVGVVRLLRTPVRESLDGFVVGVTGALSFAGAGTLTWLAPQWASDLLDDYSSGRLIEEAALYGFADPLISASIGGLLGMTLWFQPRRRSGKWSGLPRFALAGLTAVAIGVYVVVYLVDAAQLPRAGEIGINLALVATALVTLRCGIQIALLHETPDSPSDELLRCVYCENVVPDMPFCPICGVATRAASRSSRRLRKASASV